MDFGRLTGFFTLLFKSLNVTVTESVSGGRLVFGIVGIRHLYLTKLAENVDRIFTVSRRVNREELTSVQPAGRDGL